MKKVGVIGTAVATLVVGAGAFGAHESQALEVKGFTFLGSGREVRSALLDQQSAANSLYAANSNGSVAQEADDGSDDGKKDDGKKKDTTGKTDDGKKESKKGGEGKCGEGKCGE